MRLGQMAPLALAAIAACEDVHGGAVELEWTLRPESGDSIDLFVGCDTGAFGSDGKTPLPPVTRMRLDWTDGETSGSASWSCTDYHGVTNFEVPVGTAQLTVTPECGSGVPALPGTYIAPAPESRAVTLGDTVDLGAIEVFVEISSCGQQPCICVGL